MIVERAEFESLRVWESSMSQPSQKESACPECGEMVRVNSLRCWNCGAFMDPAMEQKYVAMQANPGPTLFSEVPDAELATFEEEGADDDFQLSIPSAEPV